ncbi:hypothetical protein [Hymenobacter sp. CRA2]|uniref:hypothetical protein n=1 Tax=Hymenobacter sp. CRA2 TaxID=1955620 RepID=UPI00098F8EC2|nr:hypothetical protein [Hymenobacter sp. CRA2]OON67998.1 hypothetical protein B0919_15135 [Hymenobacter sp. CRA2]
MRVLLLSLLPLSGLLLALPSAAQAQFQGRMPPLRSNWTPEAASVSGTPIAYAKPARPVGFQPDSTARRLLALHRVKAVTKVQLDEQGKVKDIVNQYEVDAAGNVMGSAEDEQPRTGRRFKTFMPNERQKIYYSPGEPNPIVLPARPNNREDMPASTLAQALRTQDGPAGDSVRLSNRKYPSAVPGMRPIARQQETFAPHPDTTLYFRYEGPDNGQLRLISVTYLLQRQGRPMEVGELALGRIRKGLGEADKAAEQAPQYGVARRLLRSGRGREVLHRWLYDQRMLLVREEINTRLLMPQLNASMPQTLNTVVLYTYNNLQQLIGRTETISSVQIPARTTYITYSYSPQGLLVGETTNSSSSKPVFYSYQYAFRN